MSELKPLPQNLVMTWHQGSKSFAEIMSHPGGSGNQRVDEWREAPVPQQLDEATYLLLFHKAINLAQQFPSRVVHYIRYDHESLPETENNRPFIMETSPRYFPGAEEKTIAYDGCIYQSGIGGNAQYEPEKPGKPVHTQLTHSQARHEKRRKKK